MLIANRVSDCRDFVCSLFSKEKKVREKSRECHNYRSQSFFTLIFLVKNRTEKKAREFRIGQKSF